MSRLEAMNKSAVIYVPQRNTFSITILLHTRVRVALGAPISGYVMLWIIIHSKFGTQIDNTFGYGVATKDKNKCKRSDKGKVNETITSI